MKTGPHDGSYWLLVEDSDDDFWMFSRACSQAFDTPPLVCRMADVQSAKELLVQSSGLRDLVVSDINLPGESGLDLLAWFRAQPSLQQIPFIILSDSQEGRDVSRASELSADDYFGKPASVGALVRLVSEIDQVF